MTSPAALFAPVRLPTQTPPASSWWDVYEPGTPQPRQQYGWTCSACSLDWVLRATQVAPDHTRPQAVEEIGYPSQINEVVGLTNINGPGQALIDVFAEYGLVADQAWLDFDAVYTWAQRTTGCMAGSAWYHWVGIRGVLGDSIWVANSAPRWKNIDDTLSRADFNRLGPFNVLLLQH